MVVTRPGDDGDAAEVAGLEDADNVDESLDGPTYFMNSHTSSRGFPQSHSHPLKVVNQRGIVRQSGIVKLGSLSKVSAVDLQGGMMQGLPGRFQYPTTMTITPITTTTRRPPLPTTPITPQLCLFVPCLANPCDTADCLGLPGVTCRENYCGGCNAHFFDEDGKNVTKRCSGKPAVVRHVEVLTQGRRGCSSLKRPPTDADGGMTLVLARRQAGAEHAGFDAFLDIACLKPNCRKPELRKLTIKLYLKNHKIDIFVLNFQNTKASASSPNHGWDYTGLNFSEKKGRMVSPKMKKLKVKTSPKALTLNAKSLSLKILTGSSNKAEQYIFRFKIKGSKPVVFNGFLDAVLLGSQPGVVVPRRKFRQTPEISRLSGRGVCRKFKTHEFTAFKGKKLNKYKFNQSQ